MKNKNKLLYSQNESGYVYNFHYHLIWATKYRCPAFTTYPLIQEMKRILVEIASQNDIAIESMEVMPEHIHLLIIFKPKYAPFDIVRILKGGSARLFFSKHPDVKSKKFWSGHLWSPSYYMSTLGNMSREVVEKYIQGQYKKQY